MTDPSSPEPRGRRSGARSRGRRGGAWLAAAAVLLAVTTLGVLEAHHIVRIRAYRSLPVCRVRTEDKVIALSFDDGPDPAYTPSVLALLDRFGAKETFFLVGRNAERYPWLVDEELADGMELGDHTWSHPHLPALPTAEAETQVGRTRDLLVGDGATIGLFRAPYGEITPDQIADVERTGLRVVHWSLALDHLVSGMGLPPERAAAEAIDDIRPGDIVLAHDAGDGGIRRDSAVTTLGLLLEALTRGGFRVTTVGQLLRTGAIVDAQPRVWFWQTGFACPG